MGGAAPDAWHHPSHDPEPDLRQSRGSSCARRGCRSGDDRDQRPACRRHRHGQHPDALAAGPQRASDRLHLRRRPVRGATWTDATSGGSPATKGSSDLPPSRATAPRSRSAPSTTATSTSSWCPSTGGVPRRLTWHPGADVVQGFTPDGTQVLFTSPRAVFTTRYTQLFTVPVKGGVEVALPIPNASRGSYSPTARGSPTTRSIRPTCSGSAIEAARSAPSPSTIRRRTPPSGSPQPAGARQRRRPAVARRGSSTSGRTATASSTSTVSIPPRSRSRG